MARDRSFKTPDSWDNQYLKMVLEFLYNEGFTSYSENFNFEGGEY